MPLTALFILLESGAFLSGCTREQPNNHARQQKTQVILHRAHAYLRSHQADLQHKRANALRYTRLKVQRAKCRLHPKDKRYCKKLAKPAPSKPIPSKPPTKHTR